ncbi:MAG: hypothetical protein HOQ11_12070 [Gemmatimonadaceae bacterium]|nr:hypothetical protein [Gemmatimonadaceae bacterium]NUQ93537.1 hypothetical protein [Gemmatimonadaceae bacterium]NUR18826.1 hypothetical protein [Gemmatimonadaceae bacterium]NUS98130.1 hypothetical protein [Gemmatimonadaceae bacterium]
MGGYDDHGRPEIGTLEADGKHLVVSVRVIFDGIEHVGRLWFAEEEWEDDGLPDRGALPGRTVDEVIALAKRLTTNELLQRYRRAQAEKRRFHDLRRITDEILAKIRYLNQVGISMRAGLLDVEGAAQELELTERQLHELVDRLRPAAGVEE